MKCYKCNKNECVTRGRLFINECCSNNNNIFYCNTCYYDINIPKMCKKCCMTNCCNKCCKFITKINLNKKEINFINKNINNYINIKNISNIISNYIIEKPPIILTIYNTNYTYRLIRYSDILYNKYNIIYIKDNLWGLGLKNISKYDDDYIKFLNKNINMDGVFVSTKPIDHNIVRTFNYCNGNIFYPKYYKKKIIYDSPTRQYYIFDIYTYNTRI